ncbi:hypothetical protein E4U35_008212 [Claviceps purpurea]|nr:hypothetical protein E4U12_004063 [Claviceps purpurea]KAG6150386.1 hypothetical protein E4U11_008401 [Claviceps purpurea]KAG6185860.1 hypothetical protein E4U36_001049 [Claviceps purpurea]KAG6195873.1 hypothetical protein E4U35_008212 [Claviceps purpurea]KAG6196157.1 hypothetical protein E4U50_008338 [Claviceps purpurea]
MAKFVPGHANGPAIAKVDNIVKINGRPIWPLECHLVTVPTEIVAELSVTEPDSFRDTDAKQQFDRWDTVTAEINIGRPLESGSGGKPKSTGENSKEGLGFSSEKKT